MKIILLGEEVDVADEFGTRLAAAMERMGDPYYRQKVEEETQSRIAEENRQMLVERSRKLLELSGLGERFFNRTFGTFCVTAENKAAYEACRKLADGFTRTTKGVLLSGNNGIGKTHLAAAIINALAEKGNMVYFGNIVDLKSRVTDAFDGGSAENVVNQLLRCDLLCIDDLGAEKEDTANSWIAELVYKIINRLYESNRGIVITTNLDAKAVEHRYGPRTLSRLCEMCEFIRYNATDHRRPATGG